MRFRTLLFGLFLVSAVVIGAAPIIPQDQDDVRGAFLTSRPKDKAASPGATAKPSRRRPKQTGSNTSSGTTVKTTTTTSSSSSTNSSATDRTKTTPVNARRIGLGLTLFMRDSNGLAVRTDPAHVFQKGDRVRVLLETNTDGYLYIFNTTNSGPPVMLYPNEELDEAGNYLQAHVPFEIPSSLAAEERLRWLVFDENAGDERLFFVFTREPLNGVPIEDELISMCKSSTSSCPVRPAANLWATLQNDMKEPLQVNKTERYGGTQTSGEQVATTRGLGLAKTDPEPSLIMMASSTSSKLVTALDLIHK